jgi:dTDP-D-glucose 4,6-dehydratase
MREALAEVIAHPDCIKEAGLGWRPVESFVSGIETTVRWYLPA